MFNNNKIKQAIYISVSESKEAMCSQLHGPLY